MNIEEVELSKAFNAKFEGNTLLKLLKVDLFFVQFLTVKIIFCK